MAAEPLCTLAHGPLKSCMKSLELDMESCSCFLPYGAFKPEHHGLQAFAPFQGPAHHWSQMLSPRPLLGIWIFLPQLKLFAASLGNNRNGELQMLLTLHERVPFFPTDVICPLADVLLLHRPSNGTTTGVAWTPDLKQVLIVETVVQIQLSRMLYLKWWYSNYLNLIT